MKTMNEMFGARKRAAMEAPNKVRLNAFDMT